MLLKTKDTPQRIAILSGLFLFIILTIFTKDDITLSGNESSRSATVQSLVENGTFSIDNSMFREDYSASVLTNFMIEKIYGRKLAEKYLVRFFLNTKRPNMLKKEK